MKLFRVFTQEFVRVFLYGLFERCFIYFAITFLFRFDSKLKPCFHFFFPIIIGYGGNSECFPQFLERVIIVFVCYRTCYKIFAISHALFIGCFFRLLNLFTITHIPNQGRAVPQCAIHCFWAVLSRQPCSMSFEYTNNPVLNLETSRR